MSRETVSDPGVDAQSITSLRGEVPRVVRLSRKAIGIAAGTGLALVGATLIYALQPASPASSEELFATKAVTLAEGLASAPQDYSQVPQLGPPLPGDLGKPILDARDRGAIAELPPVGTPPRQAIGPEETARQRFEQERDAARASRLFFGGTTPAASLSHSEPADGQSPLPGQGATAATRPAERRTVAEQRLEAPASAALLQAGSIIPAALITGIRSDQPGLVVAQVTQNVYDSATGRRLLVPQGSRLIGDYQSDVNTGQRRVLLAWNRLILPDGRSIVLERQPAANPSGFAGLEDRVDRHWGGVFKATLVSTLLALGSQAGTDNQNDLVRALRRGGADGLNRAGEQVVARELGVPPTLEIRPGYPVRVLLTRDIVLEDMT
ncbi:TrbI/VirB10 family protein [Erythrobacter sp.]|uniref:TrbI/VirB10 family protein n=1 Tax=Erythrobacter sp. TaxID=1042 RepID=UPI00311F8983